jgi:hypothetical protein
VAVRPDEAQRDNVLSFPATDKVSDKRYGWWQERGCGALCWEVDALDPNTLRQRVDDAIRAHIDPHKWELSQAIEADEQRDIAALLQAWHTMKNGGTAL